ncbi:uncharacterized protein NPIL_647401, partial [Nephila pilipes]
TYNWLYINQNIQHKMHSWTPQVSA